MSSLEVCLIPSCLVILWCGRDRLPRGRSHNNIQRSSVFGFVPRRCHLSTGNFRFVYLSYENVVCVVNIKRNLLCFISSACGAPDRTWASFTSVCTSGGARVRLCVLWPAYWHQLSKATRHHLCKCHITISGLILKLYRLSCAGLLFVIEVESFLSSQLRFLLVPALHASVRDPEFETV